MKLKNFVVMGAALVMAGCETKNKEPSLAGGEIVEMRSLDTAARKTDLKRDTLYPGFVKITPALKP